MITQLGVRAPFACESQSLVGVTNEGVVRFDFETGQYTLIISQPDVDLIRLSCDAKFVVVGVHGELRCLEIATCETLWKHRSSPCEKPAFGIHVDSSGRLTVPYVSNRFERDLRLRKVPGIMDGPVILEIPSAWNFYRRLSFSKTGRLLTVQLAYDDDRQSFEALRFFDLVNGKEGKLPADHRLFHLQEGDFALDEMGVMLALRKPKGIVRLLNLENLYYRDLPLPSDRLVALLREGRFCIIESGYDQVCYDTHKSTHVNVGQRSWRTDDCWATVEKRDRSVLLVTAEGKGANVRAIEIGARTI